MALGTFSSATKNVDNGNGTPISGENKVAAGKRNPGKVPAAESARIGTTVAGKPEIAQIVPRIACNGLGQPWGVGTRLGAAGP
jgi:hypothetical protein